MARVLLIDDEPDLVEMCELVLESAGHSVIRHEGQLHALELCGRPESRPDVVLLDLVMPGMRGEEVLEQLRSRVSDDIPVVVMSALPDGDRRAEELDAEGFLGKPFGPDALTSAVDRAIASKQERRTP